MSQQDDYWNGYFSGFGAGLRCGAEKVAERVHEKYGADDIEEYTVSIDMAGAAGDIGQYIEAQGFPVDGRVEVSFEYDAFMEHLSDTLPEHVTIKRTEEV